MQATLKNIEFIEVPKKLINQGSYNSLGKTHIVLKNGRYVGVLGVYPEVPEGPEIYRLWLKGERHRDFDFLEEVEHFVDENA